MKDVVREEIKNILREREEYLRDTYYADESMRIEDLKFLDKVYDLFLQ